MGPAVGSASRRILLVDDEPVIRDVVREAVFERGDEWLTATTGAEGLTLALQRNPDLVILDLGLPDVDGLEVCRRMRGHTTNPIIVLSARQSEAEKVALLDAGADDYVTKPFSRVELRARVQAQLRRARLIREQRGPIRVGGLAVDVERRVVTRDGEEVHLTPTEWALLAALAANMGRTMTHQQLFRAAWGDGTFGSAQQYLRVYITHLRKKIETVAYAPRVIVTEPGVGYRFEPESEFE